jgi:cytochrome c biogenesis protein CcdA
MNLILAFIAGVLSIFSPCVLPLVPPIVLGTALSAHRFGPLLLVAGLTLSFLVMGVVVAGAGYSIGVDDSSLRIVSAVLLVGVGIVLMAPRLQAQVALAAGPISNWTEQRLSSATTSGLGGQFLVGLLLGVVWTPCVGPTRGAASVLAAQGEQLGEVVATMAAFAVGTSIPLLLIGLLSREVFLCWRGRFLTAGTTGKAVMGGLLVATGLFILTGTDKVLQAGLLNVLPIWMLELSARY